MHPPRQVQVFFYDDTAHKLFMMDMLMRSLSRSSHNISCLLAAKSYELYETVTEYLS